MPTLHEQSEHDTECIEKIPGKFGLDSTKVEIRDRSKDKSKFVEKIKNTQKKRQIQAEKREQKELKLAQKREEAASRSQIKNPETKKNFITMKQ